MRLCMVDSLWSHYSKELNINLFPLPFFVFPFSLLLTSLYCLLFSILVSLSPPFPYLFLLMSPISSDVRRQRCVRCAVDTLRSCARSEPFTRTSFDRTSLLFIRSCSVLTSNWPCRAATELSLAPKPVYANRLRPVSIDTADGVASHTAEDGDCAAAVLHLLDTWHRHKETRVHLLLSLFFLLLVLLSCLWVCSEESGGLISPRHVSRLLNLDQTHL